ncbi:MAG: GNAT family N-acetyltransferase [Parachlamydiales bacterium]|nr:GNAT family N-acetyltransferase [Parachlamydiales bacterium]
MFTIRKAHPQDTSLILQMIRELADFEQLLDQVVADEKTLHESLFVDPKGPEVLIAEENGRAVGFVLFFHNFSTFLGRKGIYIEDLYVRPECRGKGYGELILKEICRLAKSRNCGRVEWWVLDWNERAVNFYKKIGAIPMSEWTVFRMTEESIDQLIHKTRGEK